MHFHNLVKYFAPIFFILYNVWYYYSDSALLWFTKLSAAAMLAVISWTLAYYLLEQIHTETVSPTGKAVLITGCDTGFGHDLATRLDRFGFNVFAGVLFPEGDGAQRLKNRCSKRLQIVKMDVTKAEDVDNAVQAIKDSQMPLWAIVNNAGIGFGAFFDWGNDVDLYKRLFDVNLFGVVRVTKKCVAMLRQSKGRIVNVASVAGRITPATMSHYCMAKHSVRVFSDAIRREFSMTRDEIKVITIEPAFYKTPIINQDSMKRYREQAFNESPEEIRNAYSALSPEDWFMKAQVIIDAVARPTINEVTEAMENGVTLLEPKLFYRCGGYHDILIWMVSHLPEVILDYFMNNKFGKVLLNVFVRLFKFG